ncbi:hypothetical protein A2841_01945 [Candidatus Kaiserbacteria bacterium RIFCSPHIGHO2_01_FULL_48_10]|uniref:Uncharacterized protein n=1 Tax=Candidatus Kaiserbacteria bacterium RIFCSPHIGHO2_01_FULL_48_10 TaxID=1798476 RepID=A0A1F6C6D9_9BACT|nr:MAG: hypothetical protein A2841_01945 [Candidatus Kaiserbacteria bacterium RIFCSPHIGHO2_01_FULL_48_10]HLC99954.1 hypothetical protein [Patescibacteria group bacterium]
MTLQTAQSIWKITKELVAEIFKISLMSYLALYLIEDFMPGFVSNFFDMNIILGVVVASGIVTAMTTKEPESFELSHDTKKSGQKLRFRDIVFICVLAIISGWLIFLKIQTLGTLALPVSVLSGIIILLMSLLILTEDSTNES